MRSPLIQLYALLLNSDQSVRPPIPSGSLDQSKVVDSGVLEVNKEGGRGGVLLKRPVMLTRPVNPLQAHDSSAGGSCLLGKSLPYLVKALFYRMIREEGQLPVLSPTNSYIGSIIKLIHIYIYNKLFPTITRRRSPELKRIISGTKEMN